MEPPMSLQYALFGPIGLPEMVIILLIIVLIFGASRLPEIGKGIGQGIKNFKSSVKDADAESK
jgi:sec-independent protein translocase protein TatA